MLPPLLTSFDDRGKTADDDHVESDQACIDKRVEAGARQGGVKHHQRLNGTDDIKVIKPRFQRHIISESFQ